MDIKNKTYKMVTPSDGMWLYNEREKTISDKAYMPEDADVSVWVEISEAKKQELEAQWQAEIEKEVQSGEIEQ
ncbi:MAG: hypothetical protein ACI4TK_15710 [Agathobacter sp.]